MSDNTIIAITTGVFLLAGAGIVLLLDLLTSMSSHDLWTCYAMFAVFLVVLVGTNIVVNWWADRHHI